MTTRHAHWTDTAGAARSFPFDYATQFFTAVRPRFRAVMQRAVAAGRAAPWQPLVHSSRWIDSEQGFVPIPVMSALCGQLLAGVTLQLERTVQRLQRSADGAWYVACDGVQLAGPFEHVVLATPPSQAAVLLAGHQDAWAAELMSRRMEPCWTLTAITDDVDWPWDAAEPDRGPLAWVVRNDRMPGRRALPGLAAWTAHASAQWSAQRIDADPQTVSKELQAALRAQLPFAGDAGQTLQWHHTGVHRWRHAGPALDCDDMFASDDALWDQSLGIGVCGDWLAGAGVEAAWQSGDELADAMAVSFEVAQSQPTRTQKVFSRPPATWSQIEAAGFNSAADERSALTLFSND